MCSVLSFALICWGGNIQIQDKDRLEKKVRKAGSRRLKRKGRAGHIDPTTYEKQNVRNQKGLTHPLHKE